MMNGRAGHGQRLARVDIFGEFRDGVRRPSGRFLHGDSQHSTYYTWSDGRLGIPQPFTDHC